MELREFPEFRGGDAHRIQIDIGVEPADEIPVRIAVFDEGEGIDAGHQELGRRGDMPGVEKQADGDEVVVIDQLIDPDRIAFGIGLQPIGHGSRKPLSDLVALERRQLAMKIGAHDAVDDARQTIEGRRPGSVEGKPRLEQAGVHAEPLKRKPFAGREAASQRKALGQRMIGIDRGGQQGPFGRVIPAAPMVTNAVVAREPVVEIDQDVEDPLLAGHACGARLGDFDPVIGTERIDMDREGSRERHRDATLAVLLESHEARCFQFFQGSGSGSDRRDA